ncbi:MBL fold metallo-hydrolase [Thermodesulfobacteriota bacterium]
MRIDRIGKIADDFYVLGHSFAPIYFLDGPSPALFDAGFARLARLYEQDIKDVLGSRSPAYLFITHSHWDHVGAAGFFKNLWPEMQVVGSHKAGEIMAKTEVTRFITEFTQRSKTFCEDIGAGSACEDPFISFEFDLLLNPDEPVELAPGCSVQALHTPGHTRDFMSYWLPEKKILIASEAVGCDFGNGRIETEFLVDYGTYRSSMKRLARLDADILCLGHRLVLTGEDVKDHMRRSLEQSAEWVAMVKDILLAEGGDIERTVSRIKELEWDHIPRPKQPEHAYEINTRTRVKAIREDMQKKKIDFG